MSVSRGTTITQSAMDALAALANSKIVFTPVIAFTSGNWLTEMNRLRAGVQAAVLASESADGNISPPTGYTSAGRINDPQFCVSGPWRFTRGGGFTGPGGSPTVGTTWKQCTYYFVAADADPGIKLITREYGTWNFLFNLLYEGGVTGDNEAQCKLAIGGAVAGKFWCDRLTWTPIRIDGDPFEDPEWTYSTDMPGVTWSVTTEHSYSLLTATFAYPVALSPGEYTFDVSVNASYSLQGGSPAVYGVNLNDPISFNVGPVTAFDVEHTTIENAPEAVHGTEAISKIAAADLAAGTLPPGIWTYNLEEIASVYEYWLRREGQIAMLSSPGLSGQFTGMTAPIRNVLVQNSISPPSPAEKYFPYGDDKMREPAPPTGESPEINQTPEGIRFRPPRYPCFRDTDTIPTDGDWPDFNPAGWQVMAITARRKAVPNAADILVAPNATSDITVKVGHMKSGVFTAGIEFLIPTGAAESAPQYVCWPIFTGTPLAYQCSEALFIAVTVGWPQCVFHGDSTMRTPVLEDHYNDIEAILNLL